MAASTKITTKSQSEQMVGVTPYGATYLNPGSDIALPGNTIVEFPMTPQDPNMGTEFKKIISNQQGQNLFPGQPTVITGKTFAKGGMATMQSSMTAPTSKDVAATLAKWAQLKGIDYDELVKEFSALDNDQQVKAYTAIASKVKEQETQQMMTPSVGMMDDSMQVAKEGGEPCIGCFDKYNPSPQAQDLNWFYKKEGGEAFPQANMYPESWAGYSGTLYATGGEAFPQAQTYLPYDRAGETRPNFMFAAGGSSDQFGGQYTNDQVYKIMEAGGLNMDPKKKRGKGMSKDQFSDYLMKNGGLTKYQARKSQVSDYGVPEGTYTGTDFPVNDSYRDNYFSYSPLGYLEKMKERGSYSGDIPTSYDEQVKLATDLQKSHESNSVSSDYGVTTHYGWTAREALDNKYDWRDVIGKELPQEYRDAWTTGKQKIYDENRPNYGATAAATTGTGTTSTATPTATAAVTPAAATSTGSTASTVSTATPGVASPPPNSTGATASTTATSGTTANTTGTTVNTTSSGPAAPTTQSSFRIPGLTENQQKEFEKYYNQYQKEGISQNQLNQAYRHFYPGTGKPDVGLMLSMMPQARGKNPATTLAGWLGAGINAFNVGKGVTQGLGKMVGAAYKAPGAIMRGASNVQNDIMNLRNPFARYGGVYEDKGEVNEDNGLHLGFNFAGAEKDVARLGSLANFAEAFTGLKQERENQNKPAFQTMNRIQPTPVTASNMGKELTNVTMGNLNQPNMQGATIQDPGASLMSKNLFAKSMPTSWASPNSPYTGIAAKYGGMMFEDGGEYDLDMDTIRELIRLGYDVEMI